jgi:hypothetical protein
LADEIRLTEIDASNIDLHTRLHANDKCLFLFEYTSGQGYSFSATNDLISNLKKKPGQPGQYYKNQAISRCAGYLRTALDGLWLDQATLVPVPPSKSADHPEYDNRMVRICQLIRPNLDVRAIVRQTQSIAAAHEVGVGERPSVEDLLQVYEIDEAQALPGPKVIGIFDDVLTAGTHYRAMQIKLSERYPGVPIFGIFIARRVFATSDFEEL